MSDLESSNRKTAEDAFELVWQTFRLDKAKLRNLSEKDKDEMKLLMKAVFMSSLPTEAATKEIKFEVTGGVNSSEIENTVRRTIQEEMVNLTSLIQNSGSRSISDGVKDKDSNYDRVISDPVVLHQSMFEADMATNIDDIKVDEGEVSNVKSNLEALRRLMGKPIEEKD